MYRLCISGNFGYPEYEKQILKNTSPKLAGADLQSVPQSTDWNYLQFLA